MNTWGEIPKCKPEESDIEKELREQLSDREAQLKIAIEALEFYAHEGLEDPRPVDSINDGGIRAREALRSLASDIEEESK